MSMCCILTFDRAIDQRFLYTGCTCVNILPENKWKQLMWFEDLEDCIGFMELYVYGYSLDMVSLSVGRNSGSQEIQRAPASSWQAPGVKGTAAHWGIQLRTFCQRSRRSAKCVPDYSRVWLKSYESI